MLPLAVTVDCTVAILAVTVLGGDVEPPLWKMVVMPITARTATTAASDPLTSQNRRLLITTPAP
jgi:hypothetical protein